MKFYLFFCLFFGIFNSFAQNEVTISMDAPNEIESGTIFNIEIKIQKSQLRCFAEMTQSLPAGFKIISGQGGAAEFVKNNNEVKFIWLRLPQNPQISVSYKVEVAPNIEGNFTLKGNFACQENNRLGKIAIPELSIKVKKPAKK